MKNVGGLDRKLRIAVGVGLIAFAASTGTAWAYLGVIPLATGLLGWCPAYCPLKISTAKSCGSCSTGKCGE